MINCEPEIRNINVAHYKSQLRSLLRQVSFVQFLKESQKVIIHDFRAESSGIPDIPPIKRLYKVLKSGILTISHPNVKSCKKA